MVPFKNILIADDHNLILEGFESCITNAYENVNIWKAKSKSELLQILKSEKIQVLFQDILFGKHDARTFIKDLKNEFKDLKIIIISTLTDNLTINTLLNQGVDGYISKADDTEELINALNAIANGIIYISPDAKNAINNTIPKKKTFITKREEIVLSLIVSGLTTKEIAEKLNISIKTIEAHRANLFARFGVKNVVELVKKAIYEGYT
ncbi:MAG TPA: response regulator transcription factor [Edaphocola sp.]|nr:response regulator transcription factor [Edaphocola sp.]